jgi:hypothetical protein
VKYHHHQKRLFTRKISIAYETLDVPLCILHHHEGSGEPMCSVKYIGVVLGSKLLLSKNIENDIAKASRAMRP